MCLKILYIPYYVFENFIHSILCQKGKSQKGVMGPSKHLFLKKKTL